MQVIISAGRDGGADGGLSDLSSRIVNAICMYLLENSYLC